MYKSSKQHCTNIFLTIIAFITSVLILVACNSNFLPTPTSIPTRTLAHTATSTNIPATPTVTHIPTKEIILPVGLMTPVPASKSKINAENVKELQEIALYKSQNMGYVINDRHITDDNRWYWITQFDFRDENFLSFNYCGDDCAELTWCDISTVNGSIVCKNTWGVIDYGLKRLVGKRLLIGNDGKYYSHERSDLKIDIFPIDDPSKIIDSIPNQYNKIVFVAALDLTNKIVIYNRGSGNGDIEAVIRDMQNGRILQNFDNASIVQRNIPKISVNKKYAAFCLMPESSKVNKLVIYDLSAKKILLYLDYGCFDNEMDFTRDENMLILHEYVSGKNPSGKLTFIDLNPPFTKKNITFKDTGGVAAFSPTENLLVVNCSQNELCFLNSSDLSEIYKFTIPRSVANLKFSKDGRILAILTFDGSISLWAVPPFDTQQNIQVEPSPLSNFK
jgi:WD40 repeat protein